MLFLEWITNTHLYMENGYAVSETELTLPNHVHAMLKAMTDAKMTIMTIKATVALGVPMAWAKEIVKTYKRGHYYHHGNWASPSRIFIIKKGRHVANGGLNVWADR